MDRNFLKSTTIHDEALLSAMTNMIATHPNAEIKMASFNAINIKGDGVDQFLEELVNQVPVLEMSLIKVKKTDAKQHKHQKSSATHCIHFSFHNSDVRKRMKIPSNVSLGDD